MEQQFQLVQKIVHTKSGELFDLAFLESVTFIEEMSLAAPKLILKFEDDESYIKDVLRVESGDEIELYIADTYARDGIDEVVKFTVINTPVVGSIITINCLHSTLWRLKQPALTARIFKKKHPSYIMKKLFSPELAIPSFRAFTAEDYHILVGERPTAMLKMLAREQGGHIFIQRDQVLLSSITELLKKKSSFTYHYNDPRKANQIIQHTRPSGEALLLDRVKRQYTGWNLTKGWENGRGGRKKEPKEVYPSGNVATLKKISTAPNPVIDFSCTGNGFLTVGMHLELVWNLTDQERLFDESMPADIVTWLVSHHYENGKYNCRVKGVKAL